VRVYLVGRLAKPRQRLGIVPRCSLALFVHLADDSLGVRVAPFGGLAIPRQRLGVVLRHALAMGVHDAEGALGRPVSLVGGLTIPRQCLAVVLAGVVLVALSHRLLGTPWLVWFRTPCVRGRCRRTRLVWLRIVA